MKGSQKPVKLSYHAREQLSYRGSTEEEVVDTIRSASWGPAQLNRLECRKDFAYDKMWNGKRYKTKQVRPIFADEVKEIVVVTVYVSYF